MTRRDLRIATVYRATPVEPSGIVAMDMIRWLRISEGLADRGYAVDMVVRATAALGSPRPTLRHVPPAAVDWSAYHAVTTFYPTGLRTLRQTGGGDHPFVVAHVGAVVGPGDETPGVFFFGAERTALWEMHQEARRRARYLTVATEESRALWQGQLGRQPPVLIVPTGVERVVPPPRRDPFAGSPAKNAVYVGNIYARHQRELNLRWQERLNALGDRLRARGIRLHFVGRGRTDRLDGRAVANVGPVDHEAVWDFLHRADVGIVLARGAVQHDEASKLYYYFRAGLPVVSEAPVPNNHLIRESGFGLIAPYGNEPVLAEMIEEAATRRWDRRSAQEHVLAHDTWDHRIDVYDCVLTAEFGLEDQDRPADGRRRAGAAT